MSKVDLAYTAGIIDGEGCITICRSGVSNAVQVRVGNTNEWLINWLFFSFGGKVHKVKKYENRKQAWEWILICKKACDFLTLILPYLKLKRPQAELAINFQSHRRRSGRKPHSDEEKAIDMAEKILMSSYNHKGDNSEHIRQIF